MSDEGSGETSMSAGDKKISGGSKRGNGQPADGAVGSRKKRSKGVNEMEPAKLSNKAYNAEVARLNVELVSPAKGFPFLRH